MRGQDVGVDEPVVDLNSDLGEGFGVWSLGDDDALLEVVTSANVACGFHAGDPATMRRVCDVAVARGVAIGAQVGYRDLAGFGRRRIDVDPADLEDEILYQIGALDAFARAAGDRVRYVKPHGALYHAAVDDGDQAAAVVGAVRRHGGGLAVLGLPGSLLLACAADAGPARGAGGLRRPRVHPRGPAGAARADGGGAQRPGDDRAAVHGARAHRHRRDGRRQPRARRRAVAVRPRRHVRRGGGRPAGAGRAARGGRGAAPVRLTVARRVLPAGERAVLVELDDEDVLGFYAALRRDPPSGAVDLVPAARTVLVAFDRPVTAADGAALRDRPPDPAGPPAGPLVVLPVRYDGPDLAEVAGSTGLDADEVVRRHAAPIYVVAFCGFAPGFAYLAGGDPALRVPRRATPRTAVPEGAVAIADTWSAVYPRATPGGWQLIGRTATPVWAPDRDPPALLTPGTRVRFTPAP